MTLHVRCCDRFLCLLKPLSEFGNNFSGREAVGTIPDVLTSKRIQVQYSIHTALQCKRPYDGYSIR